MNSRRDNPMAPGRRNPGGTDGALPSDDLETIAAFIDQRLPADHHRAFVERLDREEALYEVFVETVRSREEEVAGDRAEEGEEDEPQAQLMAHSAVPAATWRRWALPAAAAAGLAIALGLAQLGMIESDEPAAERLVADGQLDGRLGEGWLEPLWSETRSIQPSSGPADLAFRVGVRALDLEIAVLGGRRDDAVRLTGQIEELLRGIELSEPARLAYSQLRRRIESGDATPGELALLASAAEAQGRDSLSDLEEPYDLGRWAEVGRLAAMSANAEVLCSPDFRRSLDELRASGEWEDEVSATLSELAELLAVPREDLDFQALGDGFASVLAAG